jgi:hypothetical protein
MDPECSLPCSQEPATGPYFEPDEYSLHLPPYFPKIHFNTLFPCTPRSYEWSFCKHKNTKFTYLLTHSLTHSLTPWCRILFEKLIVTQLVRKYPAFLWNSKVHYRVRTSPPLDPILSRLNPVPKVNLNVILPPTPRSFQWSLPFGPSNQNPVNTSPSPMRATCPAHLILLDLITLKIQNYRSKWMRNLQRM